MRIAILLMAIAAFGQTKIQVDADKWEPCDKAHRCSPVSESWPMVTNRWEDWLVDDFKAGTVIYVAPWPKLPIPKELIH